MDTESFLDTERLLKNVQQHITLNEEEKNYFLSLLSIKELDRKEYLLHTGDTCRYISFVNTGCLKVFYLDNEGVEYVVKFALEDWWAVDIESFVLQSPSFYGIQALEPTQLLQFSKIQFDELCRNVPAFEKFFRVLYQNSFIALQRRIQQSLSSTAAERYRHFQEKYPSLEQRVSQRHIAAYLGITPEFLSTLRRQFAKGALSKSSGNNP